MQTGQFNPPDTFMHTLADLCAGTAERLGLSKAYGCEVGSALCAGL